MPRRRLFYWPLVALSTLMLAGCPKGNPDFRAGKRAEAIQDYDTALEHYERALKADPRNAEYKLKAMHLRFEAGQYHVEQGEKALKKGDLTLALAEFQKAQAIDPSNGAAPQEAQRTLNAIEAERAAQAPPPPPETKEVQMRSMPPELKPLSREPINLKMTNESRIVFETIAKLAGLSVIFDPDFTSRRVTVDLPNITLEQALDAVALESKAFWKPVTTGIILVAPDQTQKRRDLEDEVVRTFYLSNTLTPQDLTEIVTGLRQLLDLRRIQQVNAQNAVVIRDTPDKLVLASKIIHDIDRAKPEVLIHVQVLEARLDRMRNLGISPGTSATLTFTPRSALSSPTTTSGSSTTTTPSTTGSVTLNNLRRLSSADYSITLPGAAATALLTDSTTRIIQDPEIRMSDGETAKLRVGDRVPIATGSFQAGVGVGVSGGTSGLVNPLVNTQFQYIDVGVNIDVTPRVHPEGDVSLKLKVEVSNVSGTRSIGGIDQPVITQRTIEHEIRLKEGEVNILGGLVQRSQTKSLTGWPGVAHIPFLRYFFSGETTDLTDDEVLIVLTPHMLRLPTITAERLRTLAAGTDTNVRVFREENPPAMAPAPLPPQGPAPTAEPPKGPGVIVPAPPAGTPPAGTGAPGTSTQPPATQPPATGATQLRFDPPSVTLKMGETSTIGLAIDGARDLFSVPLLLQYNPAVIQVEEVRNGGFLSGGTQEIAIVQRVDQAQGHAIVSATRQPNTQGVNGSGTLLGIIVRAVGPGTSKLQIGLVNAKDSQQRSLAITAGEATIQVQQP
jgi:general secretion pathway protein D